MDRHAGAFRRLLVRKVTIIKPDLDRNQPRIGARGEFSHEGLSIVDKQIHAGDIDFDAVFQFNQQTEVGTCQTVPGIVFQSGNIP
ncbi:MAG: hypothetical protein BWY71_01428 [Planctomycetes bacterium ADurb.Bin412]|nr:MAG: hypothetical protein BWY71_01428 [Planctomycetes bacterium ADurb.Bin412]